jgi:hypothetical protein
LRDAACSRVAQRVLCSPPVRSLARTLVEHPTQLLVADVHAALAQRAIELRDRDPPAAVGIKRRERPAQLLARLAAQPVLALDCCAPLGHCSVEERLAHRLFEEWAQLACELRELIIAQLAVAVGVVLVEQFEPLRRRKGGDAGLLERPVELALGHGARAVDVGGTEGTLELLFEGQVLLWRALSIARRALALRHTRARRDRLRFAAQPAGTASAGLGASLGGALGGALGAIIRKVNVEVGCAPLLLRRQRITCPATGERLCVGRPRVAGLLTKGVGRGRRSGDERRRTIASGAACKLGRSARAGPGGGTATLRCIVVLLHGRAKLGAAAVGLPAGLGPPRIVQVPWQGGGGNRVAAEAGRGHAVTATSTAGRRGGLRLHRSLTDQLQQQALGRRVRAVVVGVAAGAILGVEGGARLGEQGDELALATLRGKVHCRDALVVGRIDGFQDPRLVLEAEQPSRDIEAHLIRVARGGAGSTRVEHTVATVVDRRVQDSTGVDEHIRTAAVTADQRSCQRRPSSGGIHRIIRSQIAHLEQAADQRLVATLRSIEELMLDGRWIGAHCSATRACSGWRAAQCVRSKARWLAALRRPLSLVVSASALEGRR